MTAMAAEKMQSTPVILATGTIVNNRNPKSALGPIPQGVMAQRIEADDE